MAGLIEALDRHKEALKGLHIIKIRAGIPKFAVNLRQHRAPQPMTPSAKINQEQFRFTKIQTQLRCQGLSNVRHG